MYVSLTLTSIVQGYKNASTTFSIDNAVQVGCKFINFDTTEIGFLKLEFSKLHSFAFRMRNQRRQQEIRNQYQTKH